MGNKHGKPRRSSNLTTPPPSNKTEVPVPPTVPVTTPPPPPPALTRLHPLLESKLSQVDVMTIFSPLEIQAIRKHLSSLLQQDENDPIVIHREEFYRFLGTTTTSLYINRLYTIFDMSGKGSVNFDDLVRGLSVLSQKATREQKLLLSFHLLDPDGKGYITKQTTTELLQSCLAECKAELDLSLSDEQIARIVDNTFEDADLDHNNLVDLHEYQALDLKHPGLFDFLTVDALNVLNHLEKVHSTYSTGGVCVE